jgi:catechol 2,3-dioxygenase-like lactoylglutathione lyase family enzyme
MVEQIVPVLRATDAAENARWYARLGFEVEGEHRFAPNMPLYAFLKRGEVRLHLSEHKGDAVPNSLVYFYVDDVDSIAEEFEVEAKDQPWGMREVWLSDPDGNRLRIGQRQPTEPES